jgi:hypothetical protein
MSGLKIPICEAPLLLLPTNSEVVANFFYEAELLKLEVFGRPFVKLS